MGNQIHPDRVINPVTMLAWDGTDFFALKCDDEGRIEIEAIILELPEGLATETTLATLATEAKLELCRLLLVSLEGKDFATGTDIGTILTELQKKADLDETQPVSGTFYQGTQPVSGTFYPGTQPVSAALLPLPSGAATSAKQLANDHNVKVTTLPDVTLDAATLAALLARVWDGSAWKKRIGTASGDASVAGYCRDTSNWRALRVNDNGELEVEVVSSALPSGAATSAKQLTNNHQVQVSNMLSGFATSAKQDTLAGKVDGLADLIFQGDYLDSDFGAASCPDNTLTTLVDYTVPGNKIAYVTCWQVGLLAKDTIIAGQLVVDGATKLESNVVNSLAGVTGVCSAKVAAGIHIIVAGKHLAGADKWMTGNLLVILVDA